MYKSVLSMYILEMVVISITEARARLPELVAHAQSEPVFVERRGRTEAVLVSPQQYERMIDALEQLEDAEAFRVAMAEEGERIPWGQVKSDLGWT
ncbi:MAG: type II toxin-antitoxin system Phd/YefM family antitoxin [Herbiconiux sp.]|nr:type II toxin-antitoxin system Phd/YefM family antitoxin [Herbiconiux sp.]